MSRNLYRALLWMHPPAFCKEFAAEMMWVYDEASAETGGAALVTDAACSLARQWFLRTALWKVMAAVVGGFLEFQVAFGVVRAVTRFHTPAAFNAVNPELSALMRLIALMTLGLLTAVILLVFWWRSLARRIGA